MPWQDKGGGGGPWGGGQGPWGRGPGGQRPPDIEEFLRRGQERFGIRDPDETVKNVAESAMREIVGQTAFELARTQGRAEIQQRTLDLMQRILDSYGAGILVTQVEMQKVDPPEDTIAAFRDVQAARADKERAVNEAQAYYNEVTNRAEGEAQRII